MKWLTKKVCNAPAWVCSNSSKAVLAMVAIWMICPPLFSQTSTGDITGGVYDQSGGAIVGATVTITDVARGLSRTLTTTNAGQYVANNQLPGTYTVRAEASGFGTVEHSNILLEVGQNVRIDLTLQPGQQTQTITVTGENLQVDTTNAVLGGTVTNDLVTDLPINGRNFVKLITVRPGSVVLFGGTNATTYNGMRGGDNLFLIDGIANFTENGEPIVNQSHGPGDSQSVLSMDAIQEFNVEVSPKAEYGWKDGAVIDVGIKSGTNDLHGTAFALGRDTNLDAGNFFSGRSQVAVENFGASLGGHIVKDKLFYFVNYEGLRYSVENSATPTMPSDIALTSAQDPTNQLSMVDACNAILTGGKTINLLSARLAGLTGIGSTGTGSCTVAPPSSTVENVFPFNPSASTTFDPHLTTPTTMNGGLFKIDYQLNAKSHLNGTYYISRDTALSYSTKIVEPQWATVNPTNIWLASGAWVYANSNWVNELRVGAAAIYQPRLAGDQNMLAGSLWPSGYGMPTGVTNPIHGGLPTITISGFSGQLGSGGAGSVRGPERNIDAVDHVSLVRGKHSFMFGLDWMRIQTDGDSYSNSQGQVAFTSLQNFLLGTTGSSKIFVGDGLQVDHNYAYGIFGQDDWRVTTRLTLNLGVRYEYYTSPQDANNYIGNFYANANPATTPALQQSGGPFQTMYHPDKANFSPRFGLAWDIRGNGRTVLRAGAGVLDNMPPNGDLIGSTPFGANFPSIGVNNSGTALNLHSPANFSTTGLLNWNLTGPVFPAAVPTVINGVTYTGVTCTPQQPCSTDAVDPYLRTPYTTQWDADLERALTNNITLDVAYVGNHTFDQISFTGPNINQAPFGYGWTNPSSALGGLSPAAYCVANAPINCLTNKTVKGAVAANEVAGATYPQYPYLSFIDQVGNQWYSRYNGLQITVTGRGYHGLTFIAGYTLDSAFGFTSSSSTSAQQEDAYNASRDYGPTPADVNNRFTFSTTYAIPGTKKVPLQILQGWQLSGILVLQSGMRWFPRDATSDIQGTGGFSNGIGQTWNYSGPVSAFQSEPHNIPCFGNLPGCNATVPAACQTAAVAPYSGNAQLQSLALAALANLGCYEQGGGVLTPPAYGTFGNATIDLFRGTPYENLDFSVFKNFKFKERVNAEFRAEFYNAFNHPAFATPNVVDPESGLGFGCACTTADGSDSVLGSGGPRSIQLGLKFTF